MNDKDKGGDKLFPDLKKEEKPAKEENVFTSLFDKEKTSESAKQDDITDAVVKKSGTKQSILGPKPKVSGVQIEAKPVSFVSTAIKLLVFAFLVLWIGSFLTMGPKFNLSGVNQQVKSQETQDDLLNVQAGLNMNNYLVGYYYLDNFAYLADSYVYKNSQYESDFTSASDKNTLLIEIGDLEEEMLASLTNAQTYLSKDLVTEGVEIEAELSQSVEFKQATVSYIENEINELSTGETADDEDVQLEIAGLGGALALLQNTVYVTEVLAVNTEDGLDLDAVADLSSGFSEITVDNFTIISQIKSSRQSWSDIIKEIENITKEVDPLYGTSVESDIQYDSYSLNADNLKVTIQGNTVTDDSRNFTLISNLIDAFEESTLFANVTERTFSKSEGTDDDPEYESSFRLEFDIQEGEDERDATTLLFEEEEEEPVKVSTDEESTEDESVVESLQSEEEEEEEEL